MGCMKCGKDTQANQIFCADCLSEMEKYPVKPNTVVQIPVQPAKKQVHHRRVTATPEERIKRLTNRIHWMSLIMVLSIGVALFFALLSFDILEKSNMQKLLGQNYSVVDETVVETTESAWNKIGGLFE